MTSLAPSTTVLMRLSRHTRSISFSTMKPSPPMICMAASGPRKPKCEQKTLQMAVSSMMSESPRSTMPVVM